MNSNYESNNMTATSLDALIQANGQAMEVREQIPYRPVVYALPEEWLNAEMELLKNASEFQPELYRLIYQRATRQEFQQMQEQQLHTIRMELREQTSSIHSTLQQDGSVREKYSSELSKMLSDSLRAMETVTSNLQKKIMKILIATAVSSVALSTLVCMALQHLAG